MATYPLCHECDGTGWILYRSETIDGKLEEAYRLCPSYCTPRRPCISSKTDHPCPRPGTLRYGLGYYCKEHIGAVHVCADVDHIHEAIYYLSFQFNFGRARGGVSLRFKTT